MLVAKLTLVLITSRRAKSLLCVMWSVKTPCEWAIRLLGCTLIRRRYFRVL